MALMRRHLSPRLPAAWGAGGGVPGQGPGVSSEGARQGLRSEQRHAGDRRGPVVTAGAPVGLSGRGDSGAVGTPTPVGSTCLSQGPARGRQTLTCHRVVPRARLCK